MARSEPGPAVGPGLPRRTLLTLVSGLAVAGGAVTERLLGQIVSLTAGTDRLAGPPQPPIVGCATWQARDPSGQLTVLGRRPTNILVHHTATANRDNVGSDDLEVLAKAIQDYHMNHLGWIDSGHHFLVNRGGLIAEGRHRSLESLRGGRWFIEGTHCVDHNDDSIGIESQGTYSEVDPPPALLVSLSALLAFACLQYRVDPSHLYGHRDFGDTACPGDRLYALLPALRGQVGRLLGRAGSDAQRVSTPPTWPLLRIADRGPRVLAAQHLLRAAGVPGVPADGEFGRTTADGVREFQRRHGMAQTGMIGGGSWPKLTVPARLHSGGGSEKGTADAAGAADAASSSGTSGREVDAALRALLGAPTLTSTRRRFTLPSTLDARAWQRLLAAAS